MYEHAKSAFLSLAAYLFSSVPLVFSVNPMAAALLCAAEGGRVAWVLGGMLLGLWQSGGSYWYIIGALCALLLRIVARLWGASPGDARAYSAEQMRRHLQTRLHQCIDRLFRPSSAASPAPTSPPAVIFDEAIHWRAAAATISALIPCLAIPIQNGLPFYDLYGAVFYLTLMPALTTLFCFAISDRPSIESIKHALVWRLVGGGILLGALCLCGRSVTVLGLAPVVVLSVILCLGFVQRYGLGAGLAIGVWCGLCYDALTIPMFLIFTLIYALLKEAIDHSASIPAALAALAYLLLCGDTTAVRRLLPSLIGGCLLFLSGQRLLQRASEIKSKKEVGESQRDEWRKFWMREQMRNDQLISHLSAASGTFSHLSEVFRQFEKKTLAPSALELRRLCEEAMDNHCRDCPREAQCASHYSLPITATLQAFTRTLQESGKVTDAQWEKDLRAFCPSRQAIMADINHGMTRLNYEKLKDAGCEPFAHECDEIAHLLRDVIRADRDDEPKSSHDDLTEQVRAYLRKHDMKAEPLIMQNRDRIEVRLMGLSPTTLTLPADQFQKDLADILDAPVSRLQYEGGDLDLLTLHTLPKLHADYVHRSLAATQASEGRGICGDTLRVFVSERGIFYALLCDGMGCGNRAAQTSGLCGIFLERLLRADLDIKTALRMFNHYLLFRNNTPAEEITTTVDLFALNLYTGQGCFVKSGAAPSLILREGRLFRVCAHTLPIGILNAVDVQIIPFEVTPGDHILLMSDGVSDTEEGEDGKEGGDWLSEYLAQDLPSDDTILIRELFNRARANGSEDDMSVISIRIFEEK